MPFSTKATKACGQVRSSDMEKNTDSNHHSTSCQIFFEISLGPLSPLPSYPRLSEAKKSGNRTNISQHLSNNQNAVPSSCLEVMEVIDSQKTNTQFVIKMLVRLGTSILIPIY